MPSLAASVASRMRTGCSVGSAWNASRSCSRSSASMPPWSSASAVAAEPCLAQELGQPALGVAVLGEHDDPLVRPVLPSGRQTAVEVGRSARVALASGRASCGARPRLHLAQQVDLRRAVGASGCSGGGAAERVVLGLGELLVVERRRRRRELVEPLGVLVALRRSRPPDRRSQGLAGRRRGCARRRPGEENSRFLSSSVTRSAALRPRLRRCSRCAAARRTRSSSAVDLALARRGTRPASAVVCRCGEPRRAVGVHDVALEPADDRRSQRRSRSGSTPRAKRWASSSSSSAVNDSW